MTICHLLHCRRCSGFPCATLCRLCYSVDSTWPTLLTSSLPQCYLAGSIFKGQLTRIRLMVYNVLLWRHVLGNAISWHSWQIVTVSTPKKRVSIFRQAVPLHGRPYDHYHFIHIGCNVVDSGQRSFYFTLLTYNSAKWLPKFTITTVVVTAYSEAYPR